MFNIDGHFSASDTRLDLGVNMIEVCVATLAGIRGCTPYWEIEVDESLPGFQSFDSPPELADYGLHFTSNGTTLVQFSFYDATQLISASINGGEDIAGRFRIEQNNRVFKYYPTETLDRENSLRLSVSRLGYGQNVSDITLNFYVDTQAPFISISNTNGSITNGDIFTIAGNCSDDFYVEKIVTNLHPWGVSWLAFRRMI